MSGLVIDASYALSLLIPDETGTLDMNAATTFSASTCLVPIIWRLEVLNSLLVAERRRRIQAGTAADRFASLDRFEINTDHEADLGQTLALARAHNLTYYDAMYLELAIRQNAAIASYDRDLLRACRRESITVATST